MQILQNKFDHREELIVYVKNLAPWAEGAHSYIQGGAHEGRAKTDGN